MIDLPSTLEVHRDAIAYVAPPGDDGDKTGDTGGTAVYVPQATGRPFRACSCAESRHATCDHLRALGDHLRAILPLLDVAPWEAHFGSSVWARLGKSLFEGQKVAASDCRVRRSGKAFLVETAEGDRNGDERRRLVRFRCGTAATWRFLERLGRAPADHADRGRVLDRLAMLQTTEQERYLAERGMPTTRQVWEASFWHRLVYHALREHGTAVRFHPAIDRRSGDFTLTVRDADGTPIVDLSVPRNRVKACLALLRDAFPEQDDLAIHPIPLKSIFRVTRDTDLDLEVRPAIEALQASGEKRFFARKTLRRFRYGDLVYLPELQVLAALESPGASRTFTAPRSMRLARSQVPGFLDAHADDIAEGAMVLEEAIADLRVVRAVDRLSVTPIADAVGTESCAHSLRLIVRFVFGDTAVDLADLVRAQAAGQPYFEIADGWVDLGARDLARLGDRFGIAPESRATLAAGDGIHLDPSRILRALGGSGTQVTIESDGDNVSDDDARAALERMLVLAPTTDFAMPPALRGSLRPYQVLGAQWLRFLWEHRLSGLLADDMGLGKTHQAMALIGSLRAEGVEAPVLVVCPTSVLSHWHAKIRDHAPGLHARVHHGPQRSAVRVVRRADVVITSYGVLRRDIDRLAGTRFAVAIFDEIQVLKNRATVAYRAARRVDADITLGLTGTPIENDLGDLKALFDLLLPGYLGSDADFARRFTDTDASERARRVRLDELQRITAPFILRRLKSSVLDELPEKTENVYTCTLSEDQAALYRQTLESRSGPLVEALRTSGGRLPYLHIFALLNRLKRICDHPALALDALGEADRYRSGKWDVYREILTQSLDTGQKVVVFSQYLGMLDLMARDLDHRDIGHAMLTGRTRDRGSVIERFNTDPDCRVFLGSLKAGGTGIDLVGGSVVIHYDRWWNAAREDQATDRVHRIGQSRHVHVLKLVTAGTLEERIAEIIDQKKDLAESVIREDDPGLAKIFSREQLLELLRPA